MSIDNKREMLTGNAAAAWGARLAEVDYVPTYPITPQTEIIEKLVYWINNGEMDAMFVSIVNISRGLSAPMTLAPKQRTSCIYWLSDLSTH